jgi:hypothetical protein
VPAMKLTPNAAMRARDVSRPRAEHLAEAEAAEGSATAARKNPGRQSTGRRGTEWGGPAPDGAETGSVEQGAMTAGVTGDDPAGRPGFPRRRRGPRDAGRRGRSSR